VSDRTAEKLGVRVGSVIRLPQLSIEPPGVNIDERFPTRYRLVGLVTPPDAANTRFAGTQAFDFVPGSLSLRDPLATRGDVVFTTRNLISRLAVTDVEARAQRTLVLPSSRADRSDTVRRALAAWVEDRRSSEGSITVLAPALDVLANVDAERDAVRRASYLLALQLALFACYVLMVVTTETAHARAHDVALAKLRGLRSRTVLLVGFAEPLVVIAVALVAGVLFATVLAQAASAAVLADGVRVRVDRALWIAVVAALAGVTGAVALGLRQVLRRSALALLRQDVQVRPARGLVVVEVAILAVAAAALYDVSSAEPT
jgi:hypothetical protein